VKPGRVQGLSAGGYYYDPARHRLVRLSAPRLADADLHTPANRQIAERSTFSIFLVCDRAAITPLYGEKWRDFALIEAGLMAQLLETSAAEENLGLCQIGEVRFDELRALFRLEERHVHVHTLLGGGVVWEEGAI
jgi:pyochelin synthetase